MKQQWDDLRTLFDGVRPLSAAERVRFLDESCGTESRFRRELEKLLAAHDEGEAEAARRAEGRRRFGIWETIGFVARDGISTGTTSGIAQVYLAQRADGQQPQRALLKVMKRSALSWDYMDRLRRERDILVRLEHPNIARLFDGGVSESGEPYLVMEYVDGLRLDDYCEWQMPGLGARLRLFLALCSAVECAHRHLILHCDVQPGNVLVTGEGTLKLLDFGVARRTDALETMGPVTPCFASPEQLRGEGLTTSSDVYGLGMTLYKLATGTVPEADGAVSPPSTVTGLSSSLCKELCGDLDNIILKAIQRDPTQRYPSAAALADDITRHLEKRPVKARSHTWAYRAERFVARNRAAVIFSALLAATVVFRDRSSRCRDN